MAIKTLKTTNDNSNIDLTRLTAAKSNRKGLKVFLDVPECVEWEIFSKKSRRIQMPAITKKTIFNGFIVNPHC